MALREVAPHVIRWISGRRAARDASITARATAAELDARAAVAVGEAWTRLSAALEERLHAVEVAERECREGRVRDGVRLERVEAELRRVGEQRDVALAGLARARTGATPPQPHDTVPADAVTTPPAGHRLTAPRAPAGAEAGDASATPRE